VSSETSAIRTQTPGNYPERNKLHLDHGGTLKKRNLFEVSVTISAFQVHIPGPQFHLFTSHTTPLCIHTSVSFHGDRTSVLVFRILTFSYCCSLCPPIVTPRGCVYRPVEPPNDTPCVGQAVQLLLLFVS